MDPISFSLPDPGGKNRKKCKEIVTYTGSNCNINFKTNYIDEPGRREGTLDDIIIGLFTTVHLLLYRQTHFVGKIGILAMGKLIFLLF